VRPPAPCNVLAWRGWPDRVLGIVEDLYQRQFAEPLDLNWTRYTGGGEFLRLLEEFPTTDVIVADREITAVFALQGRLLPLWENSDLEVVRRELVYPEWLWPASVIRGPFVFGVPVRWGTTPLLVKKELLAASPTAGSGFDVRQALRDAHSFLLWSPKGYYLPSMAVLAEVICPSSPFVLTPSEFGCLSDLLHDISDCTPVVARGVGALVQGIEDARPDVITCVGEWVLEGIQEGDPSLFEAIKRRYSYVYAEAFRPVAFFEEVGVLSTTRDPQRARRIARILLSEEIRQRVRVLEAADGYASNPTWGKSDVLGPDFGLIPADRLLASCIPRQVPCGHTLQPALDLWHNAWQDFLSACP